MNPPRWPAMLMCGCLHGERMKVEPGLGDKMWGAVGQRGDGANAPHSGRALRRTTPPPSLTVSFNHSLRILSIP